MVSVRSPCLKITETDMLKRGLESLVSSPSELNIRMSLTWSDSMAMTFSTLVSRLRISLSSLSSQGTKRAGGVVLQSSFAG